MRQNLNRFIIGYITERLGARPYRKSWFKMDCPFCGKKDKLGISISRNHVNCFYCGQHGNPLEMIKELEQHSTINETIKYLTNNPNYENYEYHEKKEPSNKVQEHFGLPDNFKLISQGQSVMAKSARGYLKKRGFNIKILSEAGWGYCISGKYKGYIIIPFKRKGQLIYYNARLFIGFGPRYMNPDKDESGIGKNNIIYNHDALDLYDQVFLCEGAINAITIGDKGIASGGKAVSKYQINEIIKSQVKRVILCLDSDAIDKSIKLASELIDFKSVKVIIFPKDKDINDLGKKETMKLIYNAKYLTRQGLNKLKNEYLGNKDILDSI